MDFKRSSPLPVLLLFALSMTFTLAEVQQQNLNSPMSSVSVAETRLRRAPAATPAPAGGFFGGGFMQFLMQALCLQITSGGGLGGGGAGLGPLFNNMLLGGFGRKRRGAGGRGNRPRPAGRRPNSFGTSPNLGFNSRNPFGALQLGANSMLTSLGVSRGQSASQILSNPRVQTLLARASATNPRVASQLNSAMANQAVGGAGGGGGTGISTDQLINLVMQAMCLQQQAAAAATPLPAALNSRPRPRPGRG